MQLCNKVFFSGWFFASNFCFLSELYYFLFLKKILSRFLGGFLLKYKKLYLYLNTFVVHLVFSFIKYSSVLAVTSLFDIVAADYPLRTRNRFEVTYCLLSHVFNFRYFVKSFVSAGWLEREIWDFFGIRFFFHTDLRRILTDYGFKGHPLRKDFPLTGFVEVRYDDVFQSILIEKVEFSQKLRVFRFLNPWALWK
jgi:NADH-quinone oxidoreductase subunit C